MPPWPEVLFVLWLIIAAIWLVFFKVDEWIEYKCSSVIHALYRITLVATVITLVLVLFDRYSGAA